MKRILCATDFGPGATEAIWQATNIARADGSALSILHVHPNPLRSYPLFPQLHQRELEEFPVLLQRVRDSLSVKIGDAGGSEQAGIEVEVTAGVPYAEIVKCAFGKQAGLVALGATSTPLPGEQRLGSVASKVLRYAPCPVLIARNGPGTGKVLVATDLSDPSYPAIVTAFEEARNRNGKLVVVHNVDGPDSPVPWGLAGPANSAETRRLRSSAKKHLVAVLRKLKIEAAHEITFGPAADSIIRLADELPAELVVIGAAGRTGLSGSFLGTVAEKVARHASSSVLVVRLRPSHP